MSEKKLVWLQSLSGYRRPLPFALSLVWGYAFPANLLDPSLLERVYIPI